MQQWGQHYWETYYSVVNMISVKLLLVLSKTHNFDSKSIDFVLSFPKSDLDVDIWVELPLGFAPQDDPILKLNNNIYGLKQGSYNWFEKLNKYLMDRYSRPSDIYSCFYLKRGMIVLTYVDYCIIVGNSMNAIYEFVHSMQYVTENFVLTDGFGIDNLRGIEIKY